MPVRCIWIATGNNPVLSGEIARRTVRIRLDAKTDQPWLRTQFRHPDLRGWIKENRGDLVWAALTLIRWWFVRGRPKATTQKLGGFESWSEVIGGILQTAGYKGFLSNLQDFYAASDTEGAAWRAFVEAWWGKFKVQEVGTAVLYPIAGGLDLGEGLERSQRTRLGKLLASVRDRVFGNYRVSRGRQKDGAQMYRLEKYS